MPDWAIRLAFLEFPVIPKHLDAERLGFLHHKARVPQSGAEQGDLLLEADFHRLEGAHGGGIHADHDLRLGQDHLSPDLFDPVPMGLRNGFQDQAEGDFLDSRLAESPPISSFWGRRRSTPKGLSVWDLICRMASRNSSTV